MQTQAWGRAFAVLVAVAMAAATLPTMATASHETEHILARTFPDRTPHAQVGWEQGVGIYHPGSPSQGCLVTNGVATFDLGGFYYDNARVHVYDGSQAVIEETDVTGPSEPTDCLDTAHAQHVNGDATEIATRTRLGQTHLVGSNSNADRIEVDDDDIHARIGVCPLSSQVAFIQDPGIHLGPLVDTGLGSSNIGCVDENGDSAWVNVTDDIPEDKRLTCEAGAPATCTVEGDGVIEEVTHADIFGEAYDELRSGWVTVCVAVDEYTEVFAGEAGETPETRVVQGPFEDTAWHLALSTRTPDQHRAQLLQTHFANGGQGMDALSGDDCPFHVGYNL